MPSFDKIAQPFDALGRITNDGAGLGALAPVVRVGVERILIAA